MELKLLEVNNEPQRMIVFEVEEDCNLWPYVLMVFDHNSANKNIPEFTYVFDAKPVNKGDFVLLHSMDGEDKAIKNQIGTYSHSFFVGENRLFPDKTRKYSVTFLKVDEYQRL